MPDTKRYARLKALLQEKITSGAYQPGDRFFSQNELMRKYGLSFSTVIRAMDELVSDGYLVRQQGKGTFIASTSPRQTKQKHKEKHVTIFAPWQNSPATAFGQVNAAEFYRHLNEAKPDWMHLHLVPIGREPEALEPWLFSKDPSHAAIALYPTPAHSAILMKMAEQSPVVALTDGNPIPGISSAVTSFALATSLAVNHLIRNGHTTIALLQPSEQNTASQSCLNGYRSALRDAAYPYNEQLVIRCKPSDPTGYHAMLQLFDQNSSLQITSVIAVGSALLPGVIYAIDSMGLRSHDQFATVCIDDQQTADNLAGRATRVIFPARETALAILTNVLDAIESNAPTPEVSLSPGLIPATTQHNA